MEVAACQHPTQGFACRGGGGERGGTSDQGVRAARWGQQVSGGAGGQGVSEEQRLGAEGEAVLACTGPGPGAHSSSVLCHELGANPRPGCGEARWDEGMRACCHSHKKQVTGN